jgi:hypothetical protein
MDHPHFLLRFVPHFAVFCILYFYLHQQHINRTGDTLTGDFRARVCGVRPCLLHNQQFSGNLTEQPPVLAQGHFF